MLLKFSRLFKRLYLLFKHDGFRKENFLIFLRLFELTFLLLINKKKILKIKARNGSFKFLFKPYKGSGYGGRGQFLYRENYDRFFNVNLYKFNRKFNTFVDIGSSRGFFSSYISNVFKSKIIAVDLYQYAITDCEENLNLNNNYDYLCKVAAVGSDLDEGQYINLDNSEVPSRTSVLNLKYSSTNSDKELILMTSLDKIVKEYDTSSIDLIKIDVEGYEYNVLKGGLNIIKKYRPIIYLEFKQFKLEILNLAKSHKYLIYIPSLEGNLMQTNELLINKNHYENIFLVPQENSINL